MPFISWDKAKEDIFLKYLYYGKIILSNKVFISPNFILVFVFLLIYKIQKSEMHWFRELYTIKIIFEKLTGIKEVQPQKKPDLKYFWISPDSHPQDISKAASLLRIRSPHFNVFVKSISHFIFALLTGIFQCVAISCFWMGPYDLG